METIAKTGKEVLKAMLWLYENRLEHLKGDFFSDKDGIDIGYESIVNIDQESKSLTDYAKNIKCACLSGCLSLIRTEGTARYDAGFILREEVKVPIPVWNDSPDTSKQDVIKLLKKLTK